MKNMSLNEVHADVHEHHEDDHDDQPWILEHHEGDQWWSSNQ